MTASPQQISIRSGMVFETKSQSRFLVLKVGRGISRSALVLWASGSVKLVTEVDYWLPKWGCQLVSHRKSNVKYARDYVASHPDLPLI